MRAALAILLFAMGAAAPGAYGVTLAWDASPDSTVVGYNFYYGGESRAYTNLTSVGTATSFTVKRLRPGGMYFFAVTAYDASGLESVPSNEVCYSVPVPPPPVQVVTISLQPMLLWATNPAGPWWLTNAPLVLTNPSGNRFFKPAGVSIEQTNL
ncbi:MAG TPA: fibronectin type III domain-containing protein [Candidatus Saccharimonadales bacterium]|nr:fibronectin type III domain-containing protein [Candidatus Saccharimonadales bacterium]